jgi:3-methylfumaryl-CoA hydratase
MTDSILDIGSWIGREASLQDMVTSAPILGLQATLDLPDVAPPPDGVAPQLSHWLYFLPHDPMRLLGEDGHPRRGAFLPPVTLPRRMWAGSRMEFLRPLRVGAQIAKRSVIGDVREKTGRTGRLVFVRVDHEISDQAGLLIRESQDIVYREQRPADAGLPPPTPRAPDISDWAREVVPDPALLFRYSALTFNSHRIHYDYPYATAVEGYVGLVVHGPLIATLLLSELVQRRPDVEIVSFEFRAINPLVTPDPFFVCGSVQGMTASLFARDGAGNLCMQASADLRGKGL